MTTTRVPPGGATAARPLAVLAAAAALLLLVLVEVGWAPLTRVDAAGLDAAGRVGDASPGLVRLLEAVELITAPRTFYLAVAVAVAVLLRRGERRLAAWAALATALGGLLGTATKLLVERARPVLATPFSEAPGYSFPSGHALNSLVGSGVLLVVLAVLLRRRPGRGAVALAACLVVLVGIDRVALGVHYASDVLAGWLIGVAVLTGVAAAMGLRPLERAWVGAVRHAQAPR